MKKKNENEILIFVSKDDKGHWKILIELETKNSARVRRKDKKQKIF